MSRNPVNQNAVIAIIYGASTTGKSTICSLLKEQLPTVKINGLDLAYAKYQAEKVRCLEAGETEPKRPSPFTIFDDAIANSKAGIPTILDMGASTPNIGKMLTDYLAKQNVSCPTFVAATYLPLAENIRRMEIRNQAALSEGGDVTNQRDIWYSVNAISKAFGALLPDDRNPKFVETLKRSQMFEIAIDHGPNPLEFPHERDNFFKNFGFDSGRETVNLFSRGARCDKIYQPLVMEDSIKIAADIATSMQEAEQVFYSRVSTNSTSPSAASLGSSITTQDRGQGKSAGTGTVLNI